MSFYGIKPCLPCVVGITETDKWYFSFKSHEAIIYEIKFKRHFALRDLLAVILNV